MMIESSFLCSSSWDLDLFHDFEPVAKTFSNIDLESIEYDLEREDSKLSSYSTTPNDFSSNSSDYEGFSLDDLDTLLPISDTFVSQILEEDNAIGFSDLEWSPFPESPKKNHTKGKSRTNSSNQKNKSVEIILSTKPWSKMSSREQLQMLHNLSEIVTRHMGIREQIEVIKIIDPSAVISPDDTEFALDCTILNDVKLKKIRDFLKKQRFHCTDSFKTLGKSSHVTASIKSSSSSKMLSRKASNSYSRMKQKQKKQKIPAFDDKRIQRKLLRQGKKEEQSGLFVYEKMIKKLNNPQEEDEDVNILE
ncbi:protein FAM199X-B-like [Uloborus diversus]|uniref:protein FAM199X-B-like n=1 Tax=Uloborus diversus TaxID=327109 RepID=UPI00240A004D|nr:protein FAM199X-B-like [Uloborus diversus]